MKITPKNWDAFQHYKHRSPPWIKLHRNLLDDMQFQRLPVASKALAPMLWLLASESNNGEISMTTEEIAFRLRMIEKDVINAIKPLIDMGFFIDDDNMLANCLQDATTEKRQSRVREEKEIDTPDGVSPIVFKDYLKVRKAKNSPWTKTAQEGLQRQADKAKMSLEQVMRICCEKNWVGFNFKWLEEDVKTQDKPTIPWHQTMGGVMAKGKELGIEPKPGETEGQYRERLIGAGA